VAIEGIETLTLPDGTEVDVRISVFSSVAAVRPPLPPPPPPPSFPAPVGYWKFNDTLADASGNGRDLSGSSVAYESGKYGQGASSLVGGGMFRANDIISVNNVSGPYTVCGWFKLAASPPRGATVGMQLGSNNLFSVGRDTSSSYAVFVSPSGFNGYVQSGADAGAGWHHVAVTVSGAVAKLYVDGSQAGSVSLNLSGNTMSESATLRINCMAAGDAVDDVAVFDVALTAGQIATIAAAAGDLSTLYT
jgi:hypothetical protein